MAATLLSLRTDLRTEMKIDPNGGIFDDLQLNDAINQALFRFQKDGNFEWDENERPTHSISVVAGTQEYEIPDDFIKIQLVKLDGKELDVVDKLDIKRTESSFATGVPDNYYTRGGYIGLDKIPASNGTLEIDYLGRLPKLTLDSDEILFADQYIQAIIKYAAYVVWSSPRGDEGTASSKFQDYQNELATLMSAYSYDTTNISFNIRR